MSLLNQIFDKSTYEDKYKLKDVNSVTMDKFRDLDSAYVMSHYKTKQEQLLAFIEHNQWRAEQRSDEWLAQRRTIVGASEVASLLGLNAYKSIAELAYGKAVKNTFKGSFNTRWGNIFECVIEQITARVFDVIIYESGSIPGIRSHITGKPLQATSPDGLSVISGNTLQQLIDEELLHNEDVVINLSENYITLFEFKVPAIRKPKGVIPKNYKPQVLTGMCTCNTDIGIFGDCLIRMTNSNTFNYNLDFSGSINDKYFRGLQVDHVLYMGFIMFSSDDIRPLPEISRVNIERLQSYRYTRCVSREQALATYPKYVQEMYRQLNDDFELFQVKDLSKADHNYTRSIFKRAVDANAIINDNYDDDDSIDDYDYKLDTSPLHIHYSTIISQDDTDDAQTWFYNARDSMIQEILTDRRRPVAIMPYKVFDVKFNLINKCGDYTESLRSKLEEFLQKTAVIKNANVSDDEKTIMISQAFPPKIKRSRKPRAARIVTIDEDELDAIFI